MKCLVWDLDRTLWPCTIAEGGVPELSDGIRDVITALDERGILQSVASRNDHDHAWEWLEKLGVAEFFVLPSIGWGPKSDSVRAIAERLNFAHDTIAFIDDQPTERAEVAFHLPAVRCYDATQATSLPGLPEFTPDTTTTDSARRREMYQAGFRRDEARASYSGADEEFLKSLDLVMTIGRATEHELARVEELTLRTSQMNATGVHYSNAALRGLLADPRHEVLVVTMSDRFGPHGAVGLLLVERHERVWHLKLLATSCRVVAFGAGAVLLRWLCDQAAAAGVHLVADFRKTERNRMMEIAYRFAGFRTDPCACVEAVRTTEAVEHLHLVPGRHDAPTTMRLDAVRLS
ncbi:HAD-IIIC family phosphatase [Umezawaea endophytica]|uniref:HAD-IIIC family phosphatase n=1 Tax=Umezawaea endophytica TaxID=1654476 RepID=UPI0035569BDD